MAMRRYIAVDHPPRFFVLDLLTLSYVSVQETGPAAALQAVLLNKAGRYSSGEDLSCDRERRP